MEISQRYLPEEALVLIFLRLPVKTLMLSRMVCKLWYDIISSSSFIEVQRRTISSTNDQYLVCTRDDSYRLICKTESVPNYRRFYYKLKSFGIDGTNSAFGLEVYGSCDGLLCVSERLLQSDSSIYLLNPVIGKAKTLPTFPIEICEAFGLIDLCFGHFDDDYKVIKIVPISGAYHVGVYNLSTDSWKIKHFDSNYCPFTVSICCPWSIYVGGVAYFVRYLGRITCFDLHDEKIKEVEYPQDSDHTHCYGDTSFSVEAFGESLALMRIKRGHLAMWVLRNCGVTDTFTWEKKVDTNLQESDYCFDLVGLKNNETYVLKDYTRSGDFCLGDLVTLWDLRKAQLKDITSDQVAKETKLLKIYPLVGSLVLFNEETIDSFVGTEPCSTCTKDWKTGIIA